MESSQFSVRCSRYPVRGTPITPGRAPMVFVRPSNMEAYRGERSCECKEKCQSLEYGCTVWANSHL
jgi:hypothetical protein